ncbi:MAG: flagellar hook-basal body protein [Phycisphaerae bacterium]|nr:flagellar hook-basal body protein [Phycisphaerae bacterium]
MDPVSKNVTASLAALTRQYEATTSNLANASTVGYKRHVTAFHQELARQMDATARATQTHPVVGRTRIDFQPGGLTESQNPLDMAITGDGFFAIQTPRGEVYTRNGCFRLNANGQVVDSSGFLVAGVDGPITIPANVGLSQIRVGEDGTVSAGADVVGRIRVVMFANPATLTPMGNGFYQAPAGTRGAIGPDARIAQGYREASNVNVVEELVNMITVTRLYESGLKTVATEDERMKTLIQTATA